MKKRYEHLSIEEREIIGQMHWQKRKAREIAEAIGRHKITVSRELMSLTYWDIMRNASEMYKRYTPCQAQKRAEERREEASKRYRLKTPEIRKYVREGVITTKTGARCYFADPYASWQRGGNHPISKGGNEQINGLVRRYLPKGTDFSKITDEEIAQIEWAINNRPRKCLGFKTPIGIASNFVALGC